MKRPFPHVRHPETLVERVQDLVKEKVQNEWQSPLLLI